MSKEKVKREQPRDREIYYEVIGLGTIFFSVIVLASIGKIGKGIQLLVRILIGDWFFAFLILVLVSGFLLLFKKEKFNLFSIRYNGFILLILSLMLLSHANFYKISLEYGSNSLVGMWNLYQIYIKDFDNSYIMGGGLIGGFIYQILFFLFGDIGSFLIIILLLSFSLIFVSNNNLVSFYVILKRFYYKLKEWAFIVISYFKKIERKPKKGMKKNILMLEDKTDNINRNLQDKVVDDLTYGLNNLFKVMGVNVVSSNYRVSYLFSQIEFEVGIIEKTTLKSRIKEIITGPFYLKTNNNSFMIEIENKFKDLVTLKRVLENPTYDIPLGLDIEDKQICLNLNYHQHLLISGSYNSGIRTFIKGLISGIILTKKNIEFKILDLNQEFSELQMYEYYNSTSNIDLLFNNISEEIERRLEVLKFLGVSSLVKANQQIKNNKIDCSMLSNIIVFINGLEKIYDDNKFQSIESKIIYLAQVGAKAGISIVCVNRRQNSISSLIKSTFPTKAVFKVNNISQSIELLDDDQAIYLVGRGDFVFRHENKIRRCQSGFITDMEYRNIIK